MAAHPKGTPCGVLPNIYVEFPIFRPIKSNVIDCWFFSFLCLPPFSKFFNHPGAYISVGKFNPKEINILARALVLLKILLVPDLP
ncbi:MAG: hypothetical protein U9N60_06595 [Thermodesulfobacteriota bacterium]|nr:hypothetical protein [Thermodesulfobacteriota bacterium]